MKHVICLLLAVVARSVAVGAGPEQILTGLENEWTQALVRRDTATFERLMAPRFVYTEDATVMNKSELIRAILDDRVTSARNQGMKVYAYGDTAVVTGTLRIVGHGKDGAFDRGYRFTDTWLFRDRRWQIIAAQDYLMPK